MELRPLLILLIDDDPEEFEIFCDAIREEFSKGKCIHALNGEAAIRLLTTELVLPDCIFLDINMPVMDGRRCIKTLKAHPTLRDIPVFVYSTSTDSKEQQDFKGLGAEDFIVKPPKFSALVQSLKTVILQSSISQNRG